MKGEVRGTVLDSSCSNVGNDSSRPHRGDLAARPPLGDIGVVLAEADKKHKAQLYDELGLELVFDSEKDRVSVGIAVPCTRSVSEGRLEPVIWPRRPVPPSARQSRSDAVFV